jgi:hypothetical protein
MSFKRNEQPNVWTRLCQSLSRQYLDTITKRKRFDKHLNKLEQVLTWLQEAGLKVNAVKSFFAQTNLEYLGYNISREGLCPSHKRKYKQYYKSKHQQLASN